MTRHRDPTDPQSCPASDKEQPERHCEYEDFCRFFPSYAEENELPCPTKGSCIYRKGVEALRSRPHTGTPESCQNCRDEFAHFCEDCPRIEKKHEYTIFGFTRQMLEQHDSVLIQRTLDTLWHRMSAYFDGDPAVESLYVNVADLATEIEALRSQPPTIGSTSPAKGNDNDRRRFIQFADSQFKRPASKGGEKE